MSQPQNYQDKNSKNPDSITEKSHNKNQDERKLAREKNTAHFTSRADNRSNSD